MDQLSRYRKRTGQAVALDVYGSGPDQPAIAEEAARLQLGWTFYPATDHANLQDYKVMVNPSLSDVVCTTTAEALAMGKFVVCADHPSNDFFKSFPNCFTYATSKEFALCLQHALAADPAPLSEEDRFRLSWEAATERFYDASYCTGLEGRSRGKGRGDQLLASLHNKMAAWPLVETISHRSGGTRDRPNLLSGPLLRVATAAAVAASAMAAFVPTVPAWARLSCVAPPASERLPVDEVVARGADQEPVEKPVEKERASSA
mmetsp:Transcript_56903/g.149899  ORF Transcript_56903/g.149899 Transcript_56903/m.149899 type:complete len:261 (+) Transcript_56903:953-1735(+)